MNDQERLLSIFLRLQSGERLSKQQLALEFGLDPKTIQRDFARLSDFIASQPLIAGEVAYDYRTHTRYLKGKSLFNKKDILIIIKILLENRALNPIENKGVIDRLLGLVSKEERQEIKSIIASELLNYRPLTDKQNRLDKIWEWSQYINKGQVLTIFYQSPYRKETKSHTILPVSLYFDAHYFYLVAFHLDYDSYTTFKIDRILSWKKADCSKPSLDYGRKFRDGDVRAYHVDAFLGKTITLELQFVGDATIVLDQFPQAEILEEKDCRTRFRIVTQDTPGLKRWLLSQGYAMRVLSPQSLVDDLRETLENLLGIYQGVVNDAI